MTCVCSAWKLNTIHHTHNPTGTHRLDDDDDDVELVHLWTALVYYCAIRLLKLTLYLTKLILFFLFPFLPRLLSLGKSLTDLNMSLNKIVSLPTEFGCLVKLSSLDLRYLLKL